MQAILIADYSFTPIEYWSGVSSLAREFIKRCLTVDPKARMTAHEALQHPWICPSIIDSNNVTDAATGMGEERDLLPNLKKNFNARRTLHKAIDTVRAINKLREAGGLMINHLDGPANANAHNEQVNGSQVVDEHGRPVGDGMAHGAAAHIYGSGGEQMEIDSRGNARGQTDEQIQAQQRRVQQVSHGLWQPGKNRR